MLKRRCQLDLLACPFLSGDFWSAVGDNEAPVVKGVVFADWPWAFVTLLERLSLVVGAAAVVDCEIRGCSTLGGPGGSTAPCPCVSALSVEVERKEAAGNEVDEEELSRDLLLSEGEGVSRRRLLRERARWEVAGNGGVVGVAGNTNIVWERVWMWLGPGRFGCTGRAMLVLLAV